MPSYLLARSVQEKEKQKSSLCCVRDTWLHAHWLHTHWLLRYELCCVTHVRTYGRSHGDSNAGRLQNTCIYMQCNPKIHMLAALTWRVYTSGAYCAQLLSVWHDTVKWVTCCCCVWHNACVWCDTVACVTQCCCMCDMTLFRVRVPMDWWLPWACGCHGRVPELLIHTMTMHVCT